MQRLEGKEWNRFSRKCLAALILAAAFSFTAHAAEIVNVSAQVGDPNEPVIEQPATPLGAGSLSGGFQFPHFIVRPYHWVVTFLGIEKNSVSSQDTPDTSSPYPEPSASNTNDGASMIEQNNADNRGTESSAPVVFFEKRGMFPALIFAAIALAVAIFVLIQKNVKK